MLKKLSILFAVVFVFSLTACKGTKTYSTEDYVNIEISGLNGNGTAHIGIDRDFYDMVDDDLFDGEATDIELAQVEIIVYEITLVVCDVIFIRMLDCHRSAVIG